MLLWKPKSQDFGFRDRKKSEYPPCIRSEREEYKAQTRWKKTCIYRSNFIAVKVHKVTVEGKKEITNMGMVSKLVVKTS